MKLDEALAVPERSEEDTLPALSRPEPCRLAGTEADTLSVQALKAMETAGFEHGDEIQSWRRREAQSRHCKEWGCRGSR